MLGGGAGKNISLGGPKRGSGFQSGTEPKATFPAKKVKRLLNIDLGILILEYVERINDILQENTVRNSDKE